MQSLSIYFLILLTTVFWGLNFNIAKYVINEVTPYTAAAERVLIAALIMFIYILVRERGHIEALSKNFVAFTILGLIGVTGFNAAFFLGLSITTPINGALIMATNPLTTVLLAALIEGNKISMQQKLGMVLSFASVVIVITGGSLTTLSQVNLANGDIIIIIGSLAWSVYGIGCRRYTKQTSLLLVTGYTMIIGAVASVLLALVMEPGQFPVLDVPYSTNAALLFMAIFGTVLAYLFWNLGMKKVGVANTSIFFNIVPVTTMSITLLQGGNITSVQLIAASGVILGVLIATGTINRIYASFERS